MKSPSLLLFLALALCACGGGQTAPAAEPRATNTETAEDPPNPMPVAEPIAGADWTPHLPELDNPSLTVRVDGPAPVEEGGRAFETRVTVTNDGDEAAVVEQASVVFDVWAADGERTACARQGEPGPAPELGPGERHELRVVALCAFPDPGEYTVRTYVSFEAEAEDGSIAVERYYAGGRDVVIR
ncbi:MAG: hypothetical protein AB7S26_10595 [Sandaracinaceae bacterium]